MINQVDIEKVIRSRNAFYERVSRIEHKAKNAIKSIINKHQTAFYELYPEEAKDKCYGRKFSPEYRWIFCSDYSEVEIEYDNIIVRTVERGIRGNADEYMTTFTLTEDLTTEEGQNKIVEEWKNQEYIKIQQRHLKEVENKKTKLLQLEEELKKLKGEQND